MAAVARDATVSRGVRRGGRSPNGHLGPAGDPVQDQQSETSARRRSWMRQRRVRLGSRAAELDGQAASASGHWTAGLPPLAAFPRPTASTINRAHSVPTAHTDSPHVHSAPITPRRNREAGARLVASRPAAQGPTLMTLVGPLALSECDVLVLDHALVPSLRCRSR